MSYATGRIYLDADSHLMERPDFLRDYATSDIKNRLSPINGGPQDKNNIDWLTVVSQPGHPPEKVAEMRAMGADLIAGPKGYLALGAFNADERIHALDQLGFNQQLVFATFSPLHALQEKDVNLKYGAAAAHNRAMADFCRSDPRLLGVGIVPLDDPNRAIAELNKLIELDLRATWVAHDDCGGRSPGHNDFDPFWAALAEAGVPFVLHVGGKNLQLDTAWMNTGRPTPTDWLGGGENVRSKDATVMHQPPETFISMMIMDGVFARHPKLRGAAVELGAGWVPEMLRRLDDITKVYSRVDESIRFDRKPSEQLTQQMGFTPFPHENVARLIDDSNSELYLFSSDYPHVEGGRDPLKKFGGYLADRPEEVQSKFYAENFLRLWPEARVS